MANTLKFGAGEWATKKGSTLAYNSENGNFKPLPFTFDRSTSATRVNKEGLIEVVSNNEPRIDFLNDSKGALKLEPSRSNLITYSEDLTQWNVILGGVFSVTSNTTDFISPSGKFDASKVEFTNSNQAIGQSPTLSGNYSGYVYIKGTQGETIRFNFGGSEQNFTLTGEWDKLERTNVTSTAGAFNLNTFGGVTSRTIYVWGAQLEQGSYATSYIPTQGSSVTRDAESCEQTPPSGIIGQTEGTVYLDFVPSNDADGLRYLSIENSSSISNGWFGIFSGLNSGVVRLRFFGDGWNIYTPYEVQKGLRYKIALSYKNGVATSIYVNGTFINNITASLNGKSFQKIRLSEAAIGFRGDADFNYIKLYTTALTDQELINLTKI